MATVNPGGGPLGTNDQSSAALYLMFHLALPAGALAGALRAPVVWRLPAAALGIGFTVLLAVNAIPLPTLLRPDTSFTTPLLSIEYGMAVFTAVAAVTWIRRSGRDATTLRGWVGVGLSLFRGGQGLAGAQPPQGPGGVGAQQRLLIVSQDFGQR